VKSVLIHSRTGPFRVIGVEGAGVPSDPSGSRLDEAATSHVVRLAFDRDRLPASGPFDVTIHTNHPEQPRVVVSVLMASSRNEVAHEDPSWHGTVSLEARR
jgi:hypothetical protein